MNMEQGGDIINKDEDGKAVGDDTFSSGGLKFGLGAALRKPRAAAPSERRNHGEKLPFPRGPGSRCPCTKPSLLFVLFRLFSSRFPQQVHRVFKGRAADVDGPGTFRHGSNNLFLEFPGALFRE